MYLVSVLIYHSDHMIKIQLKIVNYNENIAFQFMR